MVKLSKRLDAVASLVRENSALADVGCDHGYLPVNLLLNNKIISAVASDINDGPLLSCKNLVSEYSLQDKVKCVLSDGLKNISVDDCDDISICGMGGELIVKILSNCDWVMNKEKHFIFNPMTHPEILRKYLCENGFEINKDFVIKDGKHYYNVFDAVYTGTISNHEESYYYLGNIDSFKHKDYFNHMLNYLENKMKGGSDYSNVIAAIKEKI